MKRFKTQQVRLAVLIAVFVLVALGILTNASAGNLCGIGWKDIALLCPLGALETMLASKTIIPQALISFVVVAVLAVLLGRVFCSWICPGALMRELKARSAAKRAVKAAGQSRAAEPAQAADNAAHTARTAAEAPLSAEDVLCDRPIAGGQSGIDASRKRRPAWLSRFDSRHAVLLGALLSSAIFGFPVFCLICPIGLAFATFALLFQFFGGVGNVSLSLLLYPLVFVIELVFLRGWCTKFCPLGALISLLSIPNRTLRPKVDTTRCIQANGGACNRCSAACLERLDPHLPARMNDCSKCGRCSAACPVQAISFTKLAEQLPGKNTPAAADMQQESAAK